MLRSFRNPFVMPIGKQREVDAKRRQLSCHSQSDHYALLRAVTGYMELRRRDRRQANRYCWDNFLSESVRMQRSAAPCARAAATSSNQLAVAVGGSQTVRMVADLSEQYRELLRDSGFLRDAAAETAANQFSGSWEVVKAALCAGLYPNVVRVDWGRKRCKLFTKGHGKIKAHPSSVNGFENGFDHRWLMYHDKVRPRPPVARAALHPLTTCARRLVVSRTTGPHGGRAVCVRHICDASVAAAAVWRRRRQRRVDCGGCQVRVPRPPGTCVYAGFILTAACEHSRTGLHPGRGLVSMTGCTFRPPSICARCWRRSGGACGTRWTCSCATPESLCPTRALP